MIKTCVTVALAALMFTATGIDSVLAKTQNKKNTDSKSTKLAKKNKKNKFSKSRNKKFKRVGNGPDLRALTTELPNNEYTEMPDNGVNAVETKTGL